MSLGELNSLQLTFSCNTDLEMELEYLSFFAHQELFLVIISLTTVVLKSTGVLVGGGVGQDFGPGEDILEKPNSKYTVVQLS